MIIHLTFGDITQEHADYVTKWASLNPEFSIYLYNDEMNDRLIQQVYPEFYTQYKSFKYNIERVDFVRYAYLHMCGGVYVDVDLEPYKPINELVLDCTHDMFPIEPTPNGFGTKFLIGNYFMSAPKGSKLMYAIMEQAVKPFVYSGNKRIDVLQRTGCLMLTKIIKDFYCVLLSPEYFTSNTRTELTYGKHHFASSWWKD